MQMKKWIAALVAPVLALGMLTGCGMNRQIARTAEYSEAGSYSASYDAAEEAAAYGAPLANRAPKESTTGSVELPQNRKWIITMNIEAETDDLDAALEAISQQLRALGGYAESQSINNTSSYRRTRNASLTVRIPADQVDAFVAEVTGFANVISNTRNVRDITLAYSDTEGRVTALKTEEQRLLELMRAAEDMSDLLEIESRLTEVRYQLESYASTLRLYDNQVDYATVDLYISEVAKYTPVEEPTFWERVTDGLADSIVGLGESIVDLIAWFIVDLPYLIAWGLVIWGAIAIGKRISRKRKAKKASKAEEKKQETKA